MKIYLLIILTSFIQLTSFCQMKRDLEKIKYIKEMPYVPELSGDNKFWNLIRYKKAIVPDLISLIDDTTLTKANVKNYGGSYRVGDIAIYALGEIIHDLNVMEFITNWEKFDSTVSVYNYYLFTRETYANRIKLKRMVEEWYQKNEQGLIWVADNELYKKKEISDKFYKYPSGGYYILKKE